MSQLGSHPTGASSVPTGADSAPTASGVCSPFPGLFITDGASFATGAESLLTASNPLPCELQPDEEGGLYWFKSDAGVTMDGSNRVSQWDDQWPNAYHVRPINSAGFALGTGQWPVYSAAPITPTGLGSLSYIGGQGVLNGTVLQYAFPIGTLNKPTPNGAAMSAFAIVKPRSAYGGTINTQRFNVLDLEMGIRRSAANPAYQVPLSSNTDSNGGYSPRVDYTGQLLACEFEFYGVGQPLVGRVLINGVALSFFPGSLESILAYTGLSGFSVGFCNAHFESFDGEIVELFAYLGTDLSNPARAVQARAYLSARSGIPL